MSVFPCFVFLLPLNGAQERRIGIPGECCHIGIGIDITVLLYKAVINPVQIFNMLLQGCLIFRRRPAFLLLVLEIYEPAYRLGNLHKPLDALRFPSCDVLLIHPGMLPVIQLPIRQCIGKIAHCRVCGNGFYFGSALRLRYISLLFRLLVGSFQITDGTFQPLVQVVPRHGMAGRAFLIAIHALIKHHLPQHHLRVVNKPGIHRDAVPILLH